MARIYFKAAFDNSRVARFRGYGDLHTRPIFAVVVDNRLAAKFKSRNKLISVGAHVREIKINHLRKLNPAKKFLL